MRPNRHPWSTLLASLPLVAAGCGLLADGAGFVLALRPGTGSHAIVAFDVAGTELGRLEYAPAP